MVLPTSTGWFGVVLDCRDASELCHFYAQLLGWRVYADTPEWATLAPFDTAGHNLGFSGFSSYERPTWPPEPGVQQMQMHLDLGVTDVAAAVAYALSAGATLAEHQPQEDVRVLLDPAGHPFCLYLDTD